MYFIILDVMYFIILQEIRAHVDIHHSGAGSQQPAAPAVVTQPPPPDLTQYNEFINRQAVEISDLRKQLAATEAKHHKELSKLESTQIVRDAQFEHQMTALQTQLTDLNDKHAEQV